MNTSVMEKLPQTTLTKNEALGIITGIEGEIRTMGAVDWEPSVFENIRNQVESGKMTPYDAVCLARKLANERQDYH